MITPQAENNMENKNLIKTIDERIKQQGKTSAFTQRKVTDTPTDALEVTPRKYVTRYSTTALRPRTSILGEFYFDTTVGLPLWWNGSAFVDAAGNVV